MKTKKFKLSPAGKLVASLAIIFASLGAAYAADIVGAGDAAHNPTISSAANGAAVVDIVAPSASGLSHNQYDSFNVNKPGAVLNNSLTDGTSQLAGQLNANANLGGNAAKVILNEVISRNPSLLLGKQEIFGMAADYVLANPNGIACDGCGFINTNRSSLVVGNPLVEKGELNGFNTFNNTHALSIGKGGLDADRALDLIAPRISAEGRISSPEQVYALTGENRVSAKGEILESRNTQKAGALDSYYLGSMQAGRIRLISTAEGSGVKIGNEISTFRLANGQVNVGDIDVASKGNLELEAAKLKGADIRLTGKNIVSKGKIISDSHNRNDSDNYDTWWSGKYVNNRDSSQRLQETSISGNDISIVAKQNNTLTGAYVQGRDVTLQGGNLKLDGQKLTQTDGHTDNRDRGAWRRNTNKESEKVEQVGTTVYAHRNAKLMADEGDIVISGSQVYANNDLSVNAKHDLHLSGLTESQTVRENGRRKNDTSRLLTGSWSNSTTTEDLKTTKLTAGTGNLGLSAGGNITSKGAEVRAKKDLIVTADKQINIDVQKTANQKTVKNDIVVWGGIGGGDDKDNGNKKEVSHSSDFSSEGKLLVSGNQGVKVTGSKVTAKEGAFVETKNGGLVIDNAISLTTDKVDQRTGTVFNITKDSKKANNSTEQSTGSELKSDADLKLFSQQDTTIVGSLVNSADELGIKTLGNLNVKSAVEQQKIDEKNTSLKVDAYAKEHSDKQYRAGLRIEHTSETEKTDSAKNKAATLSGGSVKIESDKDVTFTGSKLETTKGDAKISGTHVAFLAAEDKTTSDKTSTKIGGGAYYTGGIDKAGSGVEVGYENSKTHTDANKAVTSSSNVAGNFTVEAKGDLTNQGTQHKVGGKLTQEAANVNNLAAKNTESSKTETLKIGAEVGANVDYSGITRPVEKAINKVGKLDVLGAASDLGDIGLPNVGIDVGANGSSSDVTKNSAKAVVTSVQAGSITTKTTGAVKDQGTQYEATKGGVTIEAKSHTSEAAANTETVNSRETKGNAGLRVYTSTGSDISADAKGEGGTTRSEKTSSNAVTGKIKAADGISIKVKEDATYQGTALDAGTGKTSVKAGGDIKFDQATDTSSESHKGFNVKLSAKGGTTPESKNFGLGLGGGTDNGSSSASDAKVSQLAGKQGVELDSGRDLTLKGSLIGGKEQPTGDVTLKAAGKVDLQAAESTSSKENTKLSGNINVGTSSTDSKTKSGGGFNLGGDVNFDKVDESATIRQGSKIDSKGTLKIESGSDDKQAIHLQGTEVTSKATVLDAKKGGIVLESAQNEEKKNNWNLGLKGSAGISQSYDKNDKGVVDSESGKDSHNVSAGINIGVEKKDAVKQQNTKINTGNLTLNSGKDTTLAGAKVTADKVTGDVGGDLRVESRKDRETGVKVGVDLGLSHTNKKEDNLVTRVSNASPVGKEKIKNALETKANKAFDKVEDKYNKFAHKNDPKQDTTNAVSFSKANDKVTLPEKLVEEKTDSAIWDKGARWAGNKVKNKVVGPAEEIGLGGHFKVNANVVNNDAINETSAISGKEGVTLNVKGNTLLNGGKISSEQGKVDLKTKDLELQEIKGNNYQGGGSVNLAPTVSGLLTGGAKDVLSGNTPFIQAHTKSENRDVKGGIEEGKKDDKAEETE
ncbi:hemagglutinin repeat-containing protein [Yersinia nurmii]|uniref:Hemagglutinin repeat-containing protein n=1 Tax=Yersinia nurmii TaxID=685706 RepID=A0AAW7K2A3_9GAMM|nr:hemagglutinin repeat-containing protein [Yersinia nurmii]MDN0086487.1 hemagglutinin repeat-containing protein [Yersinia nurmii]